VDDKLPHKCFEFCCEALKTKETQKYAQNALTKFIEDHSEFLSGKYFDTLLQISLE